MDFHQVTTKPIENKKKRSPCVLKTVPSKDITKVTLYRYVIPSEITRQTKFPCDDSTLQNVHRIHQKMVKTLPKILYHGVKIFLRSLRRSVTEEIELSNQAARLRYDQKIPLRTSEGEQMSLEEAKMVLNLDRSTPEEVEERFRYLFEANRKENGGSFYLQSKVVRAKEKVNIEINKEFVDFSSK